MEHSKRFNQRFCIETVLTQKSSQRYCLQDVAILTQGKGCSRLQPSCQLDFQQLEMAYLVMSSPICPSCLPHRNCSYSFHHIQPSSRTFSQAVPKHWKWKIDVRIRASSRGQDGSDAGPESFELRVFLWRLEAEATLIGCSMGHSEEIQSMILHWRVLTRHRRALRAIACKMWLSLPKGKGCRRLQPSCQLDFQHLEMASLVMSSPICSSCLSDRNCPYSLQHIQPSHFCSWKFASAPFRLYVNRSQFARERSQVLFWASRSYCGDTSVCNLCIEIACLAC